VLHAVTTTERRLKDDVAPRPSSPPSSKTSESQNTGRFFGVDNPPLIH
jgi:hypothetical protein